MRYLASLGQNSFKRNVFLTCFFISIFTLLVSTYFCCSFASGPRRTPADYQQHYQRLVNKLRSIQYNNANILYIYTLVPTAEKNILEFVLDTQITEDKNKNNVLEPEEKRAEVGENLTQPCKRLLRNQVQIRK